ncbi:MAG: hypothetical protein RL495_1335 [Verrucomicrobiota bacterium]|jgi:hypothetical protein
MKKTSLFITIAFCVAIGFLVARFITPSEAPAPAKVEQPVVTPTPKPKPAVATKPTTPAPAKRPAMDEATKARYKAFGEETRKIAMDLAGGDEKKLGQAIRNGMLDPSSQEILKRGREIGEAFRAAETDEQRAALESEVIALREQAMSALKTQLDKLDAAPAAAPAVPAPVIPTQGLM